MNNSAGGNDEEKKVKRPNMEKRGKRAVPLAAALFIAACAHEYRDALLMNWSFH